MDTTVHFTRPEAFRSRRLASLMPASLVPIATYRLQFNGNFRFEDARGLIGHLHQLGISDIYASPVFASRRGSLHGYDVTDPTRLNPELGTVAQFDGLCRDLKNSAMGLLLDIVPNHMAASRENPWWRDVLENGPASPFAEYFDIDWHPSEESLQNRVLLPILGAPLQEVIENQELTVSREGGGFSLHYHVHRLPLSLASYRLVLGSRIESLGSNHPAIRRVKELSRSLLARPTPDSIHFNKGQDHSAENNSLKQRLRRLQLTHPEIKSWVGRNLESIGGGKGEPKSFVLLKQLLHMQFYRLSFWCEGNKSLNYRRFFDISDLAGVRVEDRNVFESTHALLWKLTRQGKVTGTRLDHIDGLKDPAEYLERLQNHLTSDAGKDKSKPYLLVEKILSPGESLPSAWPVAGTTGYDFLNLLNGLFVNSKGSRALLRSYLEFLGRRFTAKDMGIEKKKQVMGTLFAGEMCTLGNRLEQLKRQDTTVRDLPTNELQRALMEVTACLPVYRTYIRNQKVNLSDRLIIAQAIRDAQRRNSAIAPLAFGFLKKALLLEYPIRAKRAGCLDFVMRWQQFTGPITAKGIEDTLLYTYNRLISSNEVGGNPDDPGLTPARFLRQLRIRQRRWPHTLNATSTHDTKRSEDVRARINVLSEIPKIWTTHLARWARWNRPIKRIVGGLPVPEGNEEILFYQTLVGSWPLAERELSSYRKRIQVLMVKAAREAKVHTNWHDPDSEHEKALQGFVAAALKRSSKNRFLKDFLGFEKRIARCGAWNSLAQVLLKITCPCVPDIYQGYELWDFSLVDPDNRRPLDFRKRNRRLREIESRAAPDSVPLIKELLTKWEDGLVKLFLTWKALNFRRSQQDVFLKGELIPLEATGIGKEHVCAFARRMGKGWVVVVTPRMTAKLSGGRVPLGRKVWGTGRLRLPRGAPRHWQNVLTGKTLKSMPANRSHFLRLHEVFRHFPVALLRPVL